MRANMGGVPVARTVTMNDLEPAMLRIERLTAGIGDAALGDFPGFASMGHIDLVKVLRERLAKRRLALGATIGAGGVDGHATAGTMEGHTVL